MLQWLLSTIWYYLALALGLFTGTVWTYRAVCVALRCSGFGTKCTVERYGKGSWAVVTGSTDGIGKAAAIYLAEQGFNVVLISRTLAKLEAVAEEVKAAGQKAGKEIKTKIVQLDFTKTYDAATFKKVYEEHLKDLDISILVNNVGMSGAVATDFLDQSEEDVHNVTTCNMYANVLLTHQIVKTFKQRNEQDKKRSAIVFTSAMASLAPIPTIGLYAASKIFTDFVAWGLMYELSKYSVDVSAWRAAGVSTNIIGNPETNIMVASPKRYVSEAFEKMTSGVHSGYFMHEIIHLVWTNLNDILPIYFCQTFFYKLFQAHMKEVDEKAKKAA